MLRGMHLKYDQFSKSRDAVVAFDIDREDGLPSGLSEGCERREERERCTDPVVV